MVGETAEHVFVRSKIRAVRQDGQVIRVAINCAELKQLQSRLIVMVK